MEIFLSTLVVFTLYNAFILPGKLKSKFANQIANQKSQEPETKKEKSIEDKIKQLNSLKEKNLINDEEYNKKKEKLLEEL